jgi:hypothetical protein
VTVYNHYPQSSLSLLFRQAVCCSYPRDACGAVDPSVPNAQRHQIVSKPSAQTGLRLIDIGAPVFLAPLSLELGLRRCAEMAAFLYRRPTTTQTVKGWTTG